MFGSLAAPFKGFGDPMNPVKMSGSPAAPFKGFGDPANPFIPFKTAQEAITMCDKIVAEINVTEDVFVGDINAQSKYFNKAQQVVDSMLGFPDDAQVQTSCGQMLAAAGLHNMPASRHLAIHNATLAIVTAARRFPKTRQMSMLALVAAITEMSVEAQVRFDHLGGIEMAVQLAEENAQDCEALGSYLHLVSTMFSHTQFIPRWINLGLGKQILHAMKTCPNAEQTRGEAINDLNLLFMGVAMYNNSGPSSLHEITKSGPNNSNTTWDNLYSSNITAFRSELVDGGVIEQLVDTLRLEPSMRDRHRPYDILGRDGSNLGSLRLATSALEVLAVLGESNAAHCEIIRDSGAVEQIGELLDRYENQSGTMISGLEYAVLTKWGYTWKPRSIDFSVVNSACTAVRKLDKTCGKGTSFSSMRERLREVANKKKPQPETFVVGDRVQVRDSTDQTWQSGLVSEVSPVVQVTPDNWPDGFSFKFVTKDPNRELTWNKTATACADFIS